MPQIRQTINLAISTIVFISCGGSKGSTNPPPNPDVISKFAGDSQVGSASAALPLPLTVLVKDGSGNAAAGVTVSWAVTGGGGSVATASSLTDANGQATMTRTLGPAAGFQTVSASISGATGSPISFTSISQVQGAFQMSAVSGSGQNDTVQATLGSPFVVLLKDHNNNPVSGVTVTFAPTTGGGGVGSPSAISDGAGHASSTRTLGTTAGAALATATVTGLIGSPVTFTATGTAGNATQVSLGSGDAQHGVVGSPLSAPHKVLIADAHGNPKAGTQIRWVVGVGGGTVSDTAPTSGVDGTASVLRTLGATLGSQTDTAIATGLTGSPIAFTATADSVPFTAAVTVGPGVMYAPTTVTVASGGKVTWTWAPASLAHSVEWLTAPGTLPTSSVIQSSGTYQVTFTTPGTYTYDCAIHGPAMTGQVIVR
jgi:plastocyanin